MHFSKYEWGYEYFEVNNFISISVSISNLLLWYIYIYIAILFWNDFKFIENLQKQYEN